MSKGPPSPRRSGHSGWRSMDDRFRFFRAAEDGDRVESLPPEAAQGAAQGAALPAHHLGGDVAVGALLVAPLAELGRQVEDDGRGEEVELAGQGDQPGAVLGLHARRVDHGEPAAGEPFRGDVVKEVEGVAGDRQVVLVVGHEAAAVVGGDHLGGPEVPPREGRLAAPRRAGEHDQGGLGKGDLHRENTAICVGEPSPGSSSPTGRKPTEYPKRPAAALCPVPELRPGPLEAVIAMAEPARGEGLEAGVVVGVGRGGDHRGRPRELEEDALEGRQPRRIDMLDHLHGAGGVVPGEALVPVGEGALEQLQALPPPGREALEAEALPGDLEGPVGDVHAGEAVALPLLEQGLEELALAAAEIDDAARPRLPERLPDRGEALLVQAHGALETLLLLFVLRLGIRLRVLLGHEPGERLLGQIALMLEVAAGDLLPLRVRGQPAFPPGQQLVQLLLPDPVVLVVVEHRKQHVEVGEQVAEPAGPRQPHLEVGALPPLREVFVERQAPRLDGVSRGVRRGGAERAPRRGRGARRPPPRGGSRCPRVGAGPGCCP